MTVEVVVSGPKWMGGGVRSISQRLKEILLEAKREVLVTVYSATEGGDEALDLLEDCLGRGLEVKLAINRLAEQRPEVQRRLAAWLTRYRAFSLFDFSGADPSDLHAKVIVVDRIVAVVGSSNLSRRGLVTNYELALIVSSEAAAEVGRVTDRLLAIATPVMRKTR